MQNLNNKLIGSYDYELEKSYGVIDIDKIKDDNNNCLKIPSQMDSQFKSLHYSYNKFW